MIIKLESLSNWYSKNFLGMQSIREKGNDSGLNLVLCSNGWSKEEGRGDTFQKEMARFYSILLHEWAYQTYYHQSNFELKET